MDYGEPFGTVARSALIALADGSATATAFLTGHHVPVELVAFAAGIGLILLVPTIAHRIRGGSQRPDEHTLLQRHRWSRALRIVQPHSARPSFARPASQSSVRLPSPVTGRARVVDGDTVVVGRLRVRLHGIDAPEMDQRGGTAARTHLSALIAGRPVTVFPIDVDIHGRTVARIETAGIDLCRAMVADGFAIAYRHFSTAYVADERTARAGRRGLWAECAFTGIESPAAHRYQVRRSEVR